MHVASMMFHHCWAAPGSADNPATAAALQDAAEAPLALARPQQMTAVRQEKKKFAA
jgi:hypothetical protein